MLSATHKRSQKFRFFVLPIAESVRRRYYCFGQGRPGSTSLLNEDCCASLPFLLFASSPQVMMWLDILTLPQARRYPPVPMEPPSALKVNKFNAPDRKGHRLVVWWGSAALVSMNRGRRVIFREKSRQPAIPSFRSTTHL